MYPFSPGTKVYLAVGSTDMRKSIDGLSILVEDYLDKDPFSGDFFVFCNRRRNIVKILYWDRNGFCVWQKRLEKHYLKWPEKKDEVMAIGRRELSWLLEGLDVQQEKAHEQLEYSSVF